MKKFLLLTFLSTGLYLQGQGQFNISAGYTNYSMKAPGFNTFFTTYNTVQAAAAKTAFKNNFPSPSGWSARLGFKLPRPDEGVSVYYNTSTGINKLQTSNTF